MTQSPNDILPVAVIGCGRMGRLHARVYSQIPQVKLAGVFDANSESAHETAEEYGTHAFDDLHDLLGLVKAVTIAVPTQHHLALATQCIDAGVACLVEKPLAKDVAECRQIVDRAKAKSNTVHVGHIERFNPAVRAMDRLEIHPRFIEVTRISPLTFRSIDVGVVLDMMIHDIDIVLKLAASRVAKIDAVGVSVIGQVEDVCNARLTFENGCVANLTASRLALKTERKLRFFSHDAFVSIDYQKKTGAIARREGNVESIRAAVEEMRRGGQAKNFADLVQLTPLEVKDVDQIRAELEAFINSIQSKSSPVVTGEDGLAAVEVAERIVAEM